MAKYISLIKYTAKGIEKVKESPKRLDAFKQLCESMGGKVEGFYLTMGRYDLVLIVDAPNPETAAKVILFRHPPFCPVELPPQFCRLLT